MQIIRNPEIKKMIAVYAIFTFAVCALTCFLFGGAVTGYMALICMAAMLLFLFMTKKRYDDISDLSYEIDKILHATESVYLVPNKEGELAILTNQIAKMVMRLQEQAEQLQNEKGNLRNAIADISHQIRTPLTSIRMTLHQLMNDELTKEERNRSICEINNMLSRIEWLTTALLKIARLESGIAEFAETAVDVSDLIRTALQPLEVMMELKNIHMDMQLQTQAAFTGDFAWTNEAVGNLLKNCIEHTPADGTLTIRTEENSLYTQIRIADNGPGISKEDFPHLFERFYKGKNSAPQNAGIGLALSRIIIGRQNGTIRAANINPHGTEFIVTFYKGAV